jgi:hypothetical protein
MTLQAAFPFNPPSALRLPLVFGGDDLASAPFPAQGWALNDDLAVWFHGVIVPSGNTMEFDPYSFTLSGGSGNFAGSSQGLPGVALWHLCVQEEIITLGVATVDHDFRIEHNDGGGGGGITTVLGRSSHASDGPLCGHISLNWPKPAPYSFGDSERFKIITTDRTNIRYRVFGIAKTSA